MLTVGSRVANVELEPGKMLEFYGILLLFWNITAFSLAKQVFFRTAGAFGELEQHGLSSLNPNIEVLLTPHNFLVKVLVIFRSRKWGGLPFQVLKCSVCFPKCLSLLLACCGLVNAFAPWAFLMAT